MEPWKMPQDEKEQDAVNRMKEMVEKLQIKINLDISLYFGILYMHISATM